MNFLALGAPRKVDPQSPVRLLVEPAVENHFMFNLVMYNRWRTVLIIIIHNTKHRESRKTVFCAAQFFRTPPRGSPLLNRQHWRQLSVYFLSPRTYLWVCTVHTSRTYLEISPNRPVHTPYIPTGMYRYVRGMYRYVQVCTRYVRVCTR